MSKIKNIIIFTVIAVVLILIYIFFIKPSPEEQNLVSSSNINTTTLVDTSTINQNSLIAQDLLSVLLGVKNIKLDDTIFSDVAFLNLHDSSILLAPLGNEGRSNPFAPIGFEAVVAPVIPVVIPPPTCVLPQILDVPTNTCIIPAPVCTLPKVLNPSTNTCVTPLKCTLPKVLDTSTNTCITPVKTP